VCIVILILILILRKKRKRNLQNRSLQHPELELEPKKEIISIDLKLTIEGLIGRGNFGEVYKGKLGEFNVAVS